MNTLRPLVFALAHRFPFVFFFLLVILSNLVGSYFNIAYNRHLIVENHLNEAQAWAFWHVVIPAYNAVAYTVSFVIIVALFRPLARCRRAIRSGRPVAAVEMASCRRRIINLPAYQVLLNLLGWLPGAVVFPLGICLIGGWEGAPYIWLQFGVSFVTSALLTTMQTFFLFEAFLVEVLYPDFFRDARPAEVKGAIRVPLGARVFLLWCSVAVVPLLALLVVTFNFTERRTDQFEDLRFLAAGVSIVGLPLGAFLMWMVGHNLVQWLGAAQRATGAIARGEFTVRMSEQRPDEFGKLTDRFNDMAGALERGEYVRETFGQFVSAEVCDEILDKYPGLGGAVQVVTVLFADIRGFTRRSEGVPPEETVRLLNRFFTLAVAAVEENGGWVNKFLGDGLMALFGAPRPGVDHAATALRATRSFLSSLARLNAELSGEGREPIRIGIGIHTGPALVGCVGANLRGPDGRLRMRREFTAIGETVNIAQRIEQLTKVHGGPVLVSEETARALGVSWTSPPIGPVSLPGYDGTITLRRIEGLADLPGLVA